MKERALLVTADIYEGKRQGGLGWLPEERQEELSQLVVSAGAEIVHKEIVKCREISPAHFIGKGKAEELQALCVELEIGVVIFNNDLTGTQQKNLEDIIQTKTVDRTQLILDIFARRAKSNEGKIQVELAQLLYILPRLKGTGVILSRLGGGIGTKGPGEQKIEVDRRKIRIRIAKLKNDLDNITKHRHTSRKQRTDFSLLTVALIGYTNAGKSTLFNALTNSNVFAEDKLFCTLDPIIRSYVLPNNQKIVISDTVGFLDKLPHHLIESFRATLEEVIDSDLLMHVIDSSHPKCREHKKAVMDVLEELGANEKPIIHVLNKVDQLESSRDIDRLTDEFEGAVPISALKKTGLDDLVNQIQLHVSRVMVRVSIEVPQHDMKVVKFMHEHANILKKEYRGQNVAFEAEVPAHLQAIIKKYQV